MLVMRLRCFTWLLGCCYAVAKVVWITQILAMQLLWCSGWLPGCCYAVAKVFWVSISNCYAVTRIFWVIGKVLLCSWYEWMMHLYSALLCIAVHPKRFTIMCVCGGGLFSITTSVQHPLGWCVGCHRTTAPVRSPHTSYRWRGERVIEQSSVCAHHTPATGGEERES